MEYTSNIPSSAKQWFLQPASAFLRFWNPLYMGEFEQCYIPQIASLMGTFDGYPAYLGVAMGSIFSDNPV
jgi:hypothetical protein